MPNRSTNRKAPAHAGVPVVGPRAAARLRILRESYGQFLAQTGATDGPDTAVEFARLAAGGTFGMNERSIVIAVCGRLPFGYVGSRSGGSG